jgi:hypothetical protein
MGGFLRDDGMTFMDIEPSIWGKGIPCGHTGIAVSICKQARKMLVADAAAKSQRCKGGPQFSCERFP